MLVVEEWLLLVSMPVVEEWLLQVSMSVVVVEEWLLQVSMPVVVVEEFSILVVVLVVVVVQEWMLLVSMPGESSSIRRRVYRSRRLSSMGDGDRLTRCSRPASLYTRDDAPGLAVHSQTGSVRS